MPESGIGSMLTRQWGGVPAWVYVAGIGAIGGGVLYFTQKKKPATDPSQAAASNASSLYPVPPVTYVTGIPDSNTGLNSQNPGGSNSPIAPGSKVKINGNGKSAMLVAPGQPYWKQGGDIPDQSVVTVTGPPVQATWATGTNPDGSWNSTPSTFLAVPISYAGGNYYVNATGLQGMGGMGGAVSSPWESFSQRWHAPTFVFGGMGGGADDGMGGAAPIHRVAKKAKMPVQRLKALNPHLRSSGYRPGPNQLVRIA